MKIYIHSYNLNQGQRSFNPHLTDNFDINNSILKNVSPSHEKKGKR